MHDFTGFQGDCLAAIAGLDGPTELEVTHGGHEGAINHDRRNPRFVTSGNANTPESTGS